MAASYWRHANDSGQRIAEAGEHAQTIERAGDGIGVVS
jgi:hypothetical protein